MKFGKKNQIILKIDDNFIDVICGNEEKISFEDTMILQDGICVDGYIKDVLELSNILTLYFNKNNIKEDTISFVLPSDDTIVRNVKMPYIKGKEFEKNLRFEIEDIISGSERYYIDYEIIKNIKGDNGKIKSCEVLVIAASKEKIDLLVELSDALGKKLNIIDTLTNTLNKVMINGNIDYTGKSSCTLYLGYNFSNISIGENLIFEMDRTIPFGVKILIRGSKDETLRINNYEEGYKIQKERFERSILNIEKFFNENKRTKEILDNFLDLIDKTMRFYSGSNENKKIKEIVLFSRINLSESILKYIETYLNIRVKYVKNQKSLGLKFKSKEENTFKYLSLYGALLRR